MTREIRSCRINGLGVIYLARGDLLSAARSYLFLFSTLSPKSPEQEQMASHDRRYTRAATQVPAQNQVCAHGANSLDERRISKVCQRRDKQTSTELTY